MATKKTAAKTDTRPKTTPVKPPAKSKKGPGSLIEDQRRKRQKIFTKALGKPVAHHRGEDLGAFAIDVLAYRKKEGRTSGFVLATNGLSDHRVPRPKASEAYPQTELLWYVRDVTEDKVRLLYDIATQPFESGKPIEFGTFQTFSEPPSQSAHTALMFLRPLPMAERLIHTELALMAGYFEQLAIHPLSDAEMRHARKSKKGFNELLDLFDENQYPLFYEPRRRSYIEPR